MKATQRLQKWVDNKVDFLNSQVPCSFLNGYTPDKQEAHFFSEHALLIAKPDVLLAKRNYYDVKSQEMKDIEAYNHKIRSEPDPNAWQNVSAELKQNMVLQGLKVSIQQGSSFAGVLG